MKTFFIILVFCKSLYAADIDQLLRSKIEFFKIKPLSPLAQTPNRSQVELGQRLFTDVNLSGNRNISCMSCHNPLNGTSDGLALSKTEDGKGILRRNSLALFNLGTSRHAFMFWDGRVHYDQLPKVFITPELNLSHDITDAMSSALSAQALFPLVSREEMRGKIGDNEIADAKDNMEAWDKIILRLKTEGNTNSRTKTYSQLFKAAYPKVPIEKINIGHVGEAIASFESEQFQSTGSPFNSYLSGNDNALNEKQKRGFVVFVDQGKCIACHQGGELGNNTFFTSSGVPQWGALPLTPDKGRGEISQPSLNNYFFRVPSLLNVSLTAPYMHNGAYQTLSEVINHYNNVRPSLLNYELPDGRAESMPVSVGVEKDPNRLDEIWKSIQAPFLRRGLNLSEEEKDDLLAFLTEALTDPRWKK